MASPRETLKPMVARVLESSGRRMTIVEVAEELWRKHELDFKKEGDLFYIWQYEMRWAAQLLVDEGKVEKSRKGWIWL